MKYIIEAYEALCKLATFTVNGIDAEYDDFGEKNDTDMENAEDYGCGNMEFTPKPATDEVLSKYKISVGEYNTIAEELKDKLSFGQCSWCV